MAGPNFGSWPTPDKDTGTVSSHGWFSYDSTKNALAAKAYQQWINSPDGPEERRKGAEHRQLRLRIDKAVDYDVSQTFMKVTSLEHAIEKFVGPSAGVISVTHKNSESVTLTIPAGDLISPIYTLAVTDSSETNIDSAPAENAPTTKTIKAELKVIGLITDINNDGKITVDDNVLRNASYRNSATDEEKNKGREYLFLNDKISNGLWDKEDKDPDKPTTAKIDDDAKEIKIEPGIAAGKVWLEHPAISGLSFYKTKECNAVDKIGLSNINKFIISESNKLPDTIFVRADEDINFPIANPQIDGDLVLKVNAGGASSQDTEVARLKFTLVKGMGSKSYFAAARDYILEQNTAIYKDKKQYKDDALNRVYIVVMRQKVLSFEALDSYRMGAGAPIAGISKVAKAFPSQNVIINGNMTFERVPVPGGGAIAEITKQCHGRIISKGKLMTGSSDNADYKKPWHLLNRHNLRGSPLAGVTAKYIAMRKKGELIFRRGRVPADLATKKSKFGISEAMGGFSTQYDTIQNEAGFFGVATIATKERMFFTVMDATPGHGDALGPRIRDDVKNGGVQALRGGQAHELELLKTDGGSSLCLAISNADGKLNIPVKGSKHSGRFVKNYVIHTYLMFKADKPRP